MAVKQQIICDVCFSDESVKRWHIIDPERRSVAPDLCERCSEGLAQFYELLPSGKGGAVRKRPVYTQDQIEAMRTPGRKRVSKKPPRKGS